MYNFWYWSKTSSVRNYLLCTGASQQTQLMHCPRQFLIELMIEAVLTNKNMMMDGMHRDLDFKVSILIHFCFDILDYCIP